jgi:hypothetical protein
MLLIQSDWQSATRYPGEGNVTQAMRALTQQKRRPLEPFKTCTVTLCNPFFFSTFVLPTQHDATALMLWLEWEIHDDYDSVVSS